MPTQILLNRLLYDSRNINIRFSFQSTQTMRSQFQRELGTVHFYIM